MKKEILEKINKFTRRTLTEDEIYVFSVILCDNDIGRDGECFSNKALEQIAELYVGKTGAFNHTLSSSNQMARIFDTEIVTDDSRLTKNGDTYRYVKANAYMIRTDENRSLIAEVDGGIKKEVSISCSINKRTCSICGCDKREVICLHKEGREYKGKQCCVVLDDITDAYEWSFVSVPIQTSKGVKRFNESNKMINREILFRGKRVDNGEWVKGCYVCTNNGRYFIKIKKPITPHFFNDVFEVIPSTRGEYTGLTDSNGVRIFEGDIIRAVHNREELNTSYIYFEYGTYWCELISGHFIDECETLFDQKSECGLEVIGNIYDNPELLKGEESNA